MRGEATTKTKRGRDFEKNLVLRLLILVRNSEVGEYVKYAQKVTKLVFAYHQVGPFAHSMTLRSVGYRDIVDVLI